MPISGLHGSLFLYALVVLALLIAELREDRRAQSLFKPLASSGFVLLAIYAGALESHYGWAILSGLMACAIGDVLLLSKNSERLFMGGMAFFALGHLAYLAACVANPAEVKTGVLIVPAIVALLVCLGVYRWIKPKLSRAMKAAVALYVGIIYIMVVFAVNIDVTGMRILVPVAAIMFAISDISVARDRFVKPGPKNFLTITPLYFGAQALFALSVQI